MSFYKRITHVVIGVKNLEETAKLYTETYGMQSSIIISYWDRGLRTQKIYTGNAHIELAESLEPDNPLAKFIEKKGEGIYLIAIQVTNLPEAVKALVASGARVVNAEQAGMFNRPDGIFLHPKSTHGALIELSE